MLIIFDAHGVIFNGGYKATAREIARRFRIPYNRVYEIMYTKYTNMAAMREVTQTEAWKRTIEELELPMSMQELRALHYGLLSVNKGMLALAKQLKKKHRIIILTKNMRSQWADTGKMFPEVWEVFGARHLINTWEYGLPKASGKTIDFLAKRFGVQPKEMIYIDDQQANLDEPARLGVKTVLYKNNTQAKKELLAASKTL